MSNMRQEYDTMQAELQEMNQLTGDDDLEEHEQIEEKLEEEEEEKKILEDQEGEKHRSKLQEQ